MSENLLPLDIQKLNEKIIDDTVKEYDDKKEIIDIIKKIKKENDNVINEFMDLVIMLTEQLAIIMPQSTISQHKNFIIEQIKNYNRFFMDGYIEKAYINKTTKDLYRKNIVEQNESFFLNNNFEDVTEGKSSIINTIFMFRDFWFQLSDENKKILKYYLSAMCYYADMRYVNFNRYLVIKKMNSHKDGFKDIFQLYDKII